MNDTDLIALLSPTVGPEKATLVVGSAVKKAGLPASFSREQALDVLEGIALQAGVVGIAARFAKVKVSLLVE